MIQVIQVYTLTMNEYKDNQFKNILVFFLDEKLSFLEYIDVKIKKATTGVNLIRKVNILLPCSFLLTVYKCFIRRYLDYYRDVIYDQPNLWL